ncbi:Rdx family-domain-containing protein [Emericellopsis atlantica]|uniref:Rdx family-domain-containing protein n=1 Tax=Emericellopsis atlantica TaxID=2614577 RepID=A0A9P7ZTC0_9HYPO|nr:Rdx family-domain-containing protein [Emericellopsis atlantica]KAG9257315.1 Rdx family-domain-containing protein [Emericellopsis atlantica]
MTMSTDAAPSSITTQAIVWPLPRVTIQFCTQCKWLLRAAYYAQELLSTFSTSLGEVALQPSTGGTFVVQIYHGTAEAKTLWDRRTDGGFPETKELKRRVRDVIEPDRNLGHVDRDYGKKDEQAVNEEKDTRNETAEPQGNEQKCEDCAT